MERKIVIGLGNPGDEFARTRHNAGRRLVERLVAITGAAPITPAAGASLWRVKHGRTEWIFALLPSEMNASGPVVRSLVRALGAKRHELIIALDDIALPEGAARLRADGTHGGHRGLASVLDALKSERVARLRIGVDRPRVGDLGDYVLSAPSPLGASRIDGVIAAAANRLLIEH
jgi:PTH1 family peptidyl-tRNA hydrolase